MPKNPSENHFPTCNRLVIAGRRYKTAVVIDIKLFRPRKQGNGIYISAKIASEKLNMYKLNYIFVTHLFDITPLKTSSS